jgi:UDP-N-acetylglucosamine:LPS N-acetylglucosamine transferase
MAYILFVSSPGGHLVEAQEISFLFKKKGLKDFKFVVHKVSKESLGQNFIIAPHAERDYRIIKQLIFAFKCLYTERPRVVISTGALISVTFCLAAKFFGIKFIYVESPTRINKASLAGKICYLMASRFYVRYHNLKKLMPNSIFIYKK